MGTAKSISTSDLYRAIAEETGLSVREVKAVFDALRQLVVKNLGPKGPGVIQIPGICKFVVRTRPARPKRHAKNPFTGKFMDLPASPSRRVVTVRALKPLKESIGQSSTYRPARPTSGASEKSTAKPPVPLGPESPDSPAPRTSVPPTTRLYEVWFGTNRQRNSPAYVNSPFGAERAKQISFGRCQVSIPESHRIGSLGSPWWKRLLTWKDDRLKLVETRIQIADNFWKSVSSTLQALPSQERLALIYLHGFNVSFEGAALRAAQIGADLEVPGITAFFSWPSKGSSTLRSYIADGATIGASENDIATFIREFVTISGAEQVHIIAHSMGNRALLRSLESILNSLSAKEKKRIGQIILAAPDVDSDEFANLASIYHKAASRTTMYVSSRDRALQSSGILNAHPRAGFLPPVTIVPGIDTIAVTDLDLTLLGIEFGLGHSHYAEARALIYDMYDLIRHGEAPDDRAGLTAATTEDGMGYWRVKA
jgi:esterase/lipase superfamily enzyme/nucleoid DNA-binding protein